MKKELTANELRERGGSENIIAGARYTSSGRDAEIAFTVEEDYRGRGIARLLLRHLVSIARDNGIAQFMAYVLAENKAMLGVFERSGLPMQTRREADALLVTLEAQRHIVRSRRRARHDAMSSGAYEESCFGDAGCLLRFRRNGELGRVHLR